MKSSIRTPSSYDDVAEMYDALWADAYLPSALPALENLFFQKLRSGAHVLDACCGSGHVTKEVVRRGLRVTGVDSSSKLIERARAALPEADFRVQDVRSLHLETLYDAALSTFDSLNHLLTLVDLREAFRSVYAALASGGMFVFDMNLEEAYSLDQQDWTVDLAADRIGLVRGAFDLSTKTATTELICFTKAGRKNLWRQTRSVVEQRCYPQAEILLALNEAGFRPVESFSARTAGVRGGLAFGRAFFRAWRQE
ncbi:MAG: class I SAM-dependent methyltransferase [Bryobacteraceae bacterium]